MPVTLSFTSPSPTLQDIDAALRRESKANRVENQLRCSDGTLYVKLKAASSVWRSEESRKRHTESAVEFVQGSAQKSLSELGLPNPEQAAKDLVTWIVPVDPKIRHTVIRVGDVHAMGRVIDMTKELLKKYQGDPRCTPQSAFRCAVNAERGALTWSKDQEQICKGFLKSPAPQDDKRVESGETLSDLDFVKLDDPSTWSLKDPEEDADLSSIRNPSDLETKSSPVEGRPLSPTPTSAALKTSTERLAELEETARKVREGLETGVEPHLLRPVLVSYFSQLAAITEADVMSAEELALNEAFLQKAQDRFKAGLAIGDKIWLTSPPNEAFTKHCEALLQRIANDHRSVYGYPPVTVVYDKDVHGAAQWDDATGTLRVSASQGTRSRTFEVVVQELVDGLAQCHQRHQAVNHSPAEPFARLMKAMSLIPMDEQLLRQHAGVEPREVKAALRDSPHRLHARTLAKAAYEAASPPPDSKNHFTALYHYEPPRTDQGTRKAAR